MSDSSASTDYDETRTIIDRDYQSYSIENSIYRVPNDDEEMQRLELQHSIFLRAIRRAIPQFAPGPGEVRILECGGGGMDWVTDVAEAVPNCQIVVFDIDGPNAQRYNVEFIRHDLNRTIPPRHDDTVHDASYDFVHSQCVGLGINANRWGRTERDRGRRETRGYVADLYRLLRRGGRAQLVEYSYLIQSDAGLLGEDDDVWKWSQRLKDSMDPPRRGEQGRIGANNRDWTAARSLKARMEAAGFVGVTSTPYRLPIGSWDSQNLDLGANILEMVGSMIDSHIKLPLAQMYGALWTEADVQRFIVNTRQELQATAQLKRLYLTLYVVEGQKR